MINGSFSRCILPCHPLSQRPARSYFGLTGVMQSGASNTLSAEASKERFIVKVIVDVLTILITLYKIMNLLQILYFFLLFCFIQLMFKNVKLSVPKTFIKSKPSVAVENDLEVRRQICVRPCTVLSSRADRSNVLICLAKLLKTYQKGSANSHTVRS